MDEKKIPALYVFLWILLSVLLISGTALMGWLYYLHVRDLRINDEQYNIVAIVQKNAQNEALKTMYLAQLLDLSLDQPVSIYTFDEKEGEKKLTSSPLIKKASIKKIRPGTLYIDYQIRTPMAYLGNYTNTAMDQEGYLFSFQPFFTPKALPAIYMSDEEREIKWGTCLKTHREFKLALKVLHTLQNLLKYNLIIKQINVSQAFSQNYGERQLIVVLAEQDYLSSTEYVTYLRLNPDHFLQNLENYMTLKLRMSKDKKLNQTIDFRIPQLAFIKNNV